MAGDALRYVLALFRGSAGAFLRQFRGDATLFDLLARWAKRRPDALALELGDARLSYRELREATTEYIRQFSARVGTPLPLPAEQLALGLLALSDGMQFSYAFDPQAVTPEMTEAVLAGFFRRVVFGESGPPQAEQP